jgi:hypothetical protein
MARKALWPAAAPAAEVVGFLDGTAVGGWVVDFARPAESAWVRGLVDERVVEVVCCDLHRADARLLNLPQGRIGFFYNIPQRFHDGRRHRLSFATPAGAPITMATREGNALAALSLPAPGAPAGGAGGWAAPGLGAAGG